jgi:hypothetical protein
MITPSGEDLPWWAVLAWLAPFAAVIAAAAVFVR